jgi:hypothetical protein
MTSDRTPRREVDDHADADLALKQALAALPPTVGEARIEALNRRVLAQWQEGRGAVAEPAMLMAGGGRGWLALQGGWRSPWVVGATGLAVGLALVVGAWLHGSDPALDELLQPDVLSQMAAGEM